MSKLATALARAVIVMLVFPLLVLVLGGVFRLLAMLVQSQVADTTAWKEPLVTVLLMLGLVVGVTGAVLVCWKAWRAVGSNDRRPADPDAPERPTADRDHRPERSTPGRGRP